MCIGDLKARLDTTAHQTEVISNGGTTRLFPNESLETYRATVLILSVSVPGNEQGTGILSVSFCAVQIIV
jgi:hypothetical protein